MLIVQNEEETWLLLFKLRTFYWSLAVEKNRGTYDDVFYLFETKKRSRAPYIS